MTSFHLFAGCSNSDGLDNFDWSHEGFFDQSDPSNIQQMLGRAIEECAKLCNENNNCVAFNHFFVNQVCYLYTRQDLVDVKIPYAGTRAYIKCGKRAMLLNDSVLLIIFYSQNYQCPLPFVVYILR